MTKAQPPKFPLHFFHWYCHPEYVEDIEGDLIERFETKVESKGIRNAKWGFTKDVIRLLRPGIIKPFFSLNKLPTIYILVHFVKLSFRKVSKPDIFSISYILGLSAALATTFLIFSYVNNAYEVDEFFSHKENLYRLVRTVEDANNSNRSPLLAAPFKDDYVTTLGVGQNNLVRGFLDDELVTYENNSFFEDQFFYVDPSFFELLDFPFQYGDLETALGKTNAVVISQRIAKKYFGTEDPLGKIIEIDNKGLLEVTGVLKRGFKSHLDVDFIAPMDALGYASKLLTNKEVHAFFYYLLSKDGVLPPTLREIDPNTRISWQPLSEVYFDNEMEFDHAKHEDENLLKSLMAIAFMIIIIAVSNCVNLTLSREFKKVQNLGVRKILGSSWIHEMIKLIVENFLLVSLAMIIALPISILLSNTILKPFMIPIEIGMPLIWLLPLISLLLTTLFTIYPGIIASTINVSTALTKKVKGTKINFLQESILTVQFALSMILIVISLLVTKQFDFLQKKELGLQPNQVLYFTSNNKHSYKNISNIKSEIENLGGVKEVAMSIGGLPNSYTESVSYKVQGKKSLQQMMTAYTSLNFPSLLGIKIVDGRLFDPLLQSEINKTALLNETAARRLGWPEQNVVGMLLEPMDYFNNGEGLRREVIGVVEDFHFESLKEGIEPLAILSTDMEETFVIKLSSSHSKETVKEIAGIWSKYIPKYPFSYHFLDEHFQQMLKKDTSQRKVLYLFSMLAIFISMTGLLGLSAHLLQTRRKEIALRTILGASILSLLLLLTSRYSRLLLLASHLCLPISIYSAKKWLSDFSYKISLSPGIFLTGIAMVIVLMLLILSQQVLRTIHLNPSDELSNE